MRKQHIHGGFIVFCLSLNTTLCHVSSLLHGPVTLVARLLCMPRPVHGHDTLRDLWRVSGPLVVG